MTTIEESNRARLKAIYDKKREQGLVHVSFTFDRRIQGDVDAAIAEVLAMEEAIARGDAVPLTFNDLRWKEPS